MALPKTKLHTADEFERFIVQPQNRDRHFELINGEIVEKPMPTEEHSILRLCGFTILTTMRLKIT